jgi:glycosyltransferase involved in cell wall biosynthesis
MKVSILLPTLNRLTYLKESLASARAQTYHDIEILVSDDGSSDESQEYIRSIAEIDPRVRLLPPNPRPGLFTNINYLIQNCGGDAFCILGDDDRLSPEFVEKLARPLLDNPQIIASFCDHWIVAGDGNVLADASAYNSGYYGRADLPEGEITDSLKQALTGSMCMGFSLYRAEVFRQELFDLNCGGAADFDYAIRAARHGKLYFVKERLGDYRAHPATTTNTSPVYMIDGAIHVFSKYRFDSAQHERARRELLLSKYRDKAVYLCVRNRREMLSCLRQYVKLKGNPFHAKIVFSLVLSLLPQNLGRRAKDLFKTVAVTQTPVKQLGNRQ